MRSVITASVMLICMPAAAKAEDCKPLQYATGVPIDITHGDLLVPVTLNQKPYMMLFDTGGIASQISRGTVATLKLHERDSPLELLDVNGNLSRTYVQIEKFSVGRLNVPNIEFQVSTHVRRR